MRNPLVLGLILILLWAATACSNSRDAVSSTTITAAHAEVLPASVSSTSASSNASAPFLASGPIVVENQVDVAAQREGVVSRILAEPGTPVKQGQLLATLDDRQVSADLEAARAKTRSIEADLKNWEAEAKVLQSDYDRAQKMWDAGLITKEQLEHARYKAESDQWDVKRVQQLLINAQNTEHSLELELEKTHIAAPFDGMVARRYVRVGQAVTRNERLFWVTAVSPMRVRFALPERFLGQIKTGSLVEVTAAEGTLDHRYPAKVIEVSPVVDPASDTIEVLAQLTGPTGDLRPGMRANIHLDNPR
ncbi:MAG TPA: efflux RND transporter periplasmic adaptor subunit [Terriglobales bacterium]|nr:efflux RND transporter periplasmic adaptor subunit [Terriglobales bacterium]